MKHIVLIFSCVFLIQCTSTMTKPTMEAIDSEFNQKSEYNFQYFEISNYEKIPVDSLISDLNSYADQMINTSSKEEELTLFFYRKKLLGSNYKDKIYDAAKENEFGGIEGHEKDLVAKVWFTSNHESEVRKVFIYEENELKKMTEFKK